MSIADKTRTTRHIAPPASAREIQEAVGVTDEDRAVVRKVMRELGYDEPRSKQASALGVRRLKIVSKPRKK